MTFGAMMMKTRKTVKVSQLKKIKRKMAVNRDQRDPAGLGQDLDQGTKNDQKGPGHAQGKHFKGMIAEGSAAFHMYMAKPVFNINAC